MKIHRHLKSKTATVLMTEEELEVFWHKLNAAEGRSFRDYSEQYEVTYKCTLPCDMYNDLDKKYKPPNC